MKIVVTGDRYWDNAETIIDAFEEMSNDYGVQPTEMILIHGAARGLDSQAAEIGKLLGMDVRPYYPHWCHSWDLPIDKQWMYTCPKDCKEMVGRPAGVIRNGKMLEDNPDIKLALSFHYDLESSKGTLDMCKRVDKAGINRRHYR